MFHASQSVSGAHIIAEVAMTTTKVNEIIAGLDTLTQLDLLRRAAERKCLKLCVGSGTAKHCYSEPIVSYMLDEKMLAMLAERRIKQQARPDCKGDIFTLVDENPQQKVDGWHPSNYWNFKLPEEGERKFDLHISLSVDFCLNAEKRGIVLKPRAYGTFVSPCDDLPNFRVWKALVENDACAPAVAREIAESDGSIVVTWTELGLGGIRKLSDLFSEFARGNERVLHLGTNNDIFSPIPHPEWRLGQTDNDVVFVLEPSQPKILAMWQAQLNAYRESLRV